MASTPVPPHIPISNPPPPPSAIVATPSSSSSYRLLATSLADTFRRSLRPWPELLDRSAFSRPDTPAEAASRLRRNLAYFRSNYIALIAAALALSLLSHLAALFALLALLATWCFLYFLRPAGQPLVLLGREFSDRETLGGLVLLTVLVVSLGPIGSVIFSALLAGAFVVCAHAALRVPDDLFLDDQGPAGFLTFFGGAPASAPPQPVAANGHA